MAILWSYRANGHAIQLPETLELLWLRTLRTRVCLLLKGLAINFILLVFTLRYVINYAAIYLNGTLCTTTHVLQLQHLPLDKPSLEDVLILVGELATIPCMYYTPKNAFFPSPTTGSFSHAPKSFASIFVRIKVHCPQKSIPSRYCYPNSFTRWLQPAFLLSRSAMVGGWVVDRRCWREDFPGSLKLHLCISSQMNQIKNCKNLVCKYCDTWWWQAAVIPKLSSRSRKL